MKVHLWSMHQRNNAYNPKLCNYHLQGTTWLNASTQPWTLQFLMHMLTAPHWRHPTWFEQVTAQGQTTHLLSAVSIKKIQHPSEQSLIQTRKIRLIRVTMMIHESWKKPGHTLQRFDHHVWPGLCLSWSQACSIGVMVLVLHISTIIILH